MHARPILPAEDPRSRELLVSSILRFATSPGDPEEGDKARRRNVDVTQFLGWRENKNLSLVEILRRDRGFSCTPGMKMPVTWIIKPRRKFYDR